MRKIITYVGYAVLLAGLALCLVGVVLRPGSVQAQMASSIDATNKWAWGTNVGWINFNPANGGVVVYDDHLEGYAWGENIGWIRLGTHTGGGTHTYANTLASNYGVNNSSGNLSGYAWSPTVGWINFDPAGSEQVTIDGAGSFDGYAWGENIGWIHFKNSSPAYNVVTRLPTAVGLASWGAGSASAVGVLLGLLLAALGSLLVAGARRRAR